MMICGNISALHDVIKSMNDIMSMKKSLFIISLLLLSIRAMAQGEVMNRPYTDLRPFHLGILVGAHLQDLEFVNVGPQTVTLADGTQQVYTITCDQDRWDNGFNVGVLGEARINDYMAVRLAPALYFGSRHVSFHNMDSSAPDSLQQKTQNMKTVYISCALDMILASKRNGNHRPYVMAGVNPVINLSGKSDDIIKLKRYDLFLEAGIGCDFYLPFFKLRPELKFMYGLTNSLDTGHASEMRDASLKPYAQSVSKARSKMIVLTFYFE